MFNNHLVVITASVSRTQWNLLVTLLGEGKKISFFEYSQKQRGEMTAYSTFLILTLYVGNCKTQGCNDVKIMFYHLSPN